MNIYEKLAAVQQELKAPKDKYNSFGEYKYRSAEGILEAVKPVLKKYGATITLSDEIVEVGGRIYVKATASFCNTEGARTSFIDKDASIDIPTYYLPITVSAFAREPEEKKKMDSAQITGTASSYARKYALNGLLLIDDTKDADTDEYQKQTGGEKKETADPRENELIDQKTVDLIEKMAKDAEVTIGAITTKPLTTFTNKQAGALIQSLRKRIETRSQK